MTELPKIKKTVTVEEEHQLYLSVDCTSFTEATLEDVRAVLGAAGYVVVEKSGYENNRRENAPVARRRDPEETSGSPVGSSGSEEGVSNSRPAECREEPGTVDSGSWRAKEDGIHFKSKEEMVEWFRSVGAAIGQLDGATVGAALLQQQVRDLSAKVVTLNDIASDAINGLRLIGEQEVAETLCDRLDAACRGDT